MPTRVTRMKWASRILVFGLYGILVIGLVVRWQNARYQKLELQIQDAARQGDKATVESLLQKHPSLIRTKKDSDPLLNLAILSKNILLAESLVARGASVNELDLSGRTPLRFAAERGEEPMVLLLLQHQANLQLNEALISAVQNGCIAAIEALLARGVDVNALVVNETPLSTAIVCNRIDVVKLLLDHKADAKSYCGGWTMLHIAATCGRTEIVEELLARGVDIEAKGFGGNTPLDEAIWAGKKEIVEILLSHGADVNRATENGPSPLAFAAGYGREEIAEILLAHGADVNSQNKDHSTPLHWAASEGQMKLVVLLLAHKADTTILAQGKWTALSLAKNRGHTEVADLLRKYGAKE